MRERVELLLGRSTRGMWVLTFHAACTRMLRVEAPRLGYTRQFTIYDQADSRRLVKQLPGRASAPTPSASRRRRSSARSPTRRTACATPPSTARMVGSYFEQTVADAYELYERELLRFNAMDFDDLLVRAVNVLELFPEVRERYQQAFRARARRRVPGHQPRAVPLADAAGRRAAQPGRGRRRRAVDLRLPRRRHPQHPRLRATTSRTRTSSSSSRTTARRRRSSRRPTR